MTTIRLQDVQVTLESASQAADAVKAVVGGMFNPRPAESPRMPEPLRRHALDGVTLEIRHGETMGILGPSGCGKTTLLRAIAGLVHLDAGTVTFDGEDMRDILPGDRGIGIVFQNYALYPNMTSYQNVGFFLHVRKRDEEIPERVREVSRVMGVGFRQLLGRHPGQLSGGERQRVAVARCIARDPKLFLFDEPLSNLDAKLRIQTRGELKRLITRYKVTGVYVTHDQTEALALCDRIAVMSEGKIEQVGTPQHLYSHPNSTMVATFFGHPPMNLLHGHIYEGHWTTPDGLTFPLPALYEFSDGRKITVGVRAEGLRVAADGPLRGEVVLVEPMPVQRAILAYVETEHGRLAAQAPLEAGVKVGEQVGLQPNPEHFHWFDGRSGRRL